jgi:hypothetical protein
MSVVKVRGIDHSHELRGYRITDRGIEVDDAPTYPATACSGHPTARGAGEVRMDMGTYQDETARCSVP